MTTRRGGCVFCGGRPLSKEHVLPRWLRDHLDYLTETQVWATDSEGVLTSVDSIPIPPGERVVKAVCVRCNSGWMAQLEGDVRPALVPLIRGRRRTTRLQAAMVARWAMKTAMMVQQINQGGSTYSANAYRAFSARSAMPEHASVYAASMDEDGVSVFNSSTSIWSVDGADGMYFSTSLWLGRLFLRVDGGDAVPLIDARRARDSTGMRQLHPQFDPVLFPTLGPEQYANTSLIGMLDLRSSDGRRTLLR